ncbi:uncharacterized protein LOC112042996 [Bicyclus anynana]|uniref:Uncharacterized protein LOC112042996 n=1 Tax=Bicyclus anynana TaxID=110368 RepID=A0ABM3LEZ0_BICAN|nr:uncharacterized protein LOC112042996 [Bicyclus anynana]
MSIHLKLLSIIISIHFLSFCFARHGEFITKYDRPYSVINIKVPRAVWHQALNPTPVLKSPVTVTIPIHVAAEDENEVEEVVNDGTEVNVSVDSTLISDESISSVPAMSDEPISSVPAVSDEPISSVPAVAPAPVVTATQPPVLQDGLPDGPVQQVTGQVTRFPCTCNNGQCGCCTGAFLDRFRMKSCGNISFVPEDFVFDVRLTVNNNTVVRRRVSASNPPPICFNPRRAPFVRICAEISNIRIRNGNAFACLDINADIGTFPIYSASFRCFGLGSAGLQTGLKPKPVSSGPKPVNLFGNGGTTNDGTILDAAGQILSGGNGNGIFGAPDGGLFGGGGGPLDAIGDAVGNLLELRRIGRLMGRLSYLHYKHWHSFVALGFKMEMYTKLFFIVTVFLSSVCGNVVSFKDFNSTVDRLRNIEVPDSSLLLFERLNLRHISNISHYARQSQGGEQDSSRRCTCSLGVCKCCTGFLMDLFNQKACMKVTYHPGDFAFDVAMSFNDRVLYENSVSGKNPRPICISPPRLTNLKVCAQFYNIFFPGRNFHFCLAMNGKWRSLQLFNFAFDCLRMGANGIAMMRPEENGGISIPNPQGGVDAVVDAGEDDIEEYDETNIVRSLLEIFDEDK